MQEILACVKQNDPSGTVSINYNRKNLYEIPRELCTMLNLTWLSFTNNDLRHLPQEIGDLTHLSALFLSNNQIEELPQSIGKLVNLHWLDLHRNNLTNLPLELFNLTQLGELRLSRNQLVSIPNEISNLTQLSELYLSDNQLTCLPPLESLTDLTFLYMEGNNFKKFPERLPPNIHWFLIDSNPFDLLPASYDNLGLWAFNSKYERHLKYSKIRRAKRRLMSPIRCMTISLLQNIEACHQLFLPELIIREILQSQ